MNKSPNHQSDKNPGNHKPAKPMIMVKDTFETEIIPDITLKGINKSVVAYKILGIR